MNRPAMRSLAWVLVAVLLIGNWAWERASTSNAQRLPSRGSIPEAPAGAEARRMPPTDPAAYPDFLPAEAVDTLRRIQDHAAHPYRQDGSVFQNRERQLPQQPRGYYREYTVVTPGSRDRGARRIVTGGDPPHEYFYTDDHYRSFRRFQLDNRGTQ